MDGSPSALLTVGLGAWGSSGLLLTLGLGVGDATNQLVDRWANVIHISVDSGRTMARIDHQHSELTVDEGRLN